MEKHRVHTPAQSVRASTDRLRCVFCLIKLPLLQATEYILSRKSQNKLCDNCENYKKVLN